MPDKCICRKGTHPWRTDFQYTYIYSTQKTFLQLFSSTIFNCPTIFEKYVEIWFVLPNSILPLLGLGFCMLLLDPCVFATGHAKSIGHFIWLKPSYWYIQLCKTLASSLLTLHKSVQCTNLIDRVFVFTFRLMLGFSKW